MGNFPVSFKHDVEDPGNWIQVRDVYSALKGSSSQKSHVYDYMSYGEEHAFYGNYSHGLKVRLSGKLHHKQLDFTTNELDLVGSNGGYWNSVFSGYGTYFLQSDGTEGYAVKSILNRFKRLSMALLLKGAQVNVSTTFLKNVQDDFVPSAKNILADLQDIQECIQNRGVPPSKADTASAASARDASASSTDRTVVKLAHSAPRSLARSTPTWEDVGRAVLSKPRDDRSAAGRRSASAPGSASGESPATSACTSSASTSRRSASAPEAGAGSRLSDDQIERMLDDLHKWYKRSMELKRQKEAAVARNKKGPVARGFLSGDTGANEKSNRVVRSRSIDGQHSITQTKETITTVAKKLKELKELYEKFKEGKEDIDSGRAFMNEFQKMGFDLQAKKAEWDAIWNHGEGPNLPDAPMSKWQMMGKVMSGIVGVAQIGGAVYGFVSHWMKQADDPSANGGKFTGEQLEEAIKKIAIDARDSKNFSTVATKSRGAMLAVQEALDKVNAIQFSGFAVPQQNADGLLIGANEVRRQCFVELRIALDKVEDAMITIESFGGALSSGGDIVFRWDQEHAAALHYSQLATLRVFVLLALRATDSRVVSRQVVAEKIDEQVKNLTILWSAAQRRFNAGVENVMIVESIDVENGSGSGAKEQFDGNTNWKVVNEDLAVCGKDGGANPGRGDMGAWPLMCQFQQQWSALQTLLNSNSL